MELVQLNIFDEIVIRNLTVKKSTFLNEEIKSNNDKNSIFLKGSVEETLEACKSLVKHVINKKFSKYKGTNIEEDLYQCGNIGVCKAYNTYKNDGRCLFKTYTCACIKNEIQNFIDSYIGKKGLSKYELNNGGLTSLDKARGNEDDEVNLYNSVSVEISENYREVENRLTFNKVISYLKENEKIVVEGLLKGKNQSQIAREMELSAERVSKIKQGAFNKMKYLLER